MKKLIIAVAIVCAAALSHAAAANWQVSAANIYDGTGGTATANKYAGAAYFFNADAATQKAVFEAFAADTANFNVTAQTGYLATGVASSGSISASNAANKFSAFDQGSGAHNFFFVLIDGDKMYTSITKANVNAGGTDDAVSVGFGNQKASSGLPNSSLAATEGWGAAGQWAQAAAQDVPEPTSGLLLLLGVAGLALRRRCA